MNRENALKIEAVSCESKRCIGRMPAKGGPWWNGQNLDLGHDSVVAMLCRSLIPLGGPHSATWLLQISDAFASHVWSTEQARRSHLTLSHFQHEQLRLWRDLDSLHQILHVHVLRLHCDYESMYRTFCSPSTGLTCLRAVFSDDILVVICQSGMVESLALPQWHSARCMEFHLWYFC